MKQSTTNVVNGARLTEDAGELLEKTANTLQIMQIHGGVLLANATVKIVQLFVDRSAKRIEEAQDVVSRSIMRLIEYLNYIEAGNEDIPLVLMALLNDLRACIDAALLSENVLFFPNVDGMQPPEIIVQKTKSANGSCLREWTRCSCRCSTIM